MALKLQRPQVAFLTSRTSKGHQCWDQFWDFPNSLWVCYAAEGWAEGLIEVAGFEKSSQPGFHGSVCVLKWSLATEARDLCRAITFSNSQDQRGHPTCLNSKFPTVALREVCIDMKAYQNTWCSSFMFQSSLTFEMSDIVEREHTVCNWAAMISLFYDSCMPVFACSWRVQA